ncbi:hypothetical protein Sme01_19080 [Sphaerisporangium melleum]|uniref:Uncharacterized protein n=1 Tax=Sphaerisporangium melleum TaxID=321316 RepID=A0A917RE91_9ACTN|nr:hypothetical protein [Sphaerisporangium melleum]GGL03161.1 hypothetical protein GCM10007964_51570 [Sphaerisporangium melleum]GII69432.1 hypothetical protein Sme01_19080 [Sphaerisporangium melleum]
MAAPSPDSIMPDDRSQVEVSELSTNAAPDRYGRAGDLIALVLILAAPLTLVLFGKASVAMVIAVAEFVAIVLRAWWRGHK